MAELEIHKFDAPVLGKSAKAIRKVDDAVRKLAADMIEAMESENGLGLAANQVGVPRRLIVIKMDDEPRVFINPRIKKMSKEKVESDEGCLSFPMILAAVKRSRSVKVVARDLDMKEVKIDAEDLLARAFQHEIDHLNGIVFIDRAEPGTVREIVIEEEGEEKESAAAEQGTQ